jgi:hypothetical protein
MADIVIARHAARREDVLLDAVGGITLPGADEAIGLAMVGPPTRSLQQHPEVCWFHGCRSLRPR